MKLRSPIITLLTGAVLALGLWIASFAAASPLPAVAGGSGTATPTASATAVASSATPASSASSPAASATTAASPSASPSPSASGGFVVPDHANYVGPVQADGGAIAITLHGNVAIAYYCNGKTIEAWMAGVPKNGHLNLVGKNSPAHAQVNYALGHARGWIFIDGTKLTFSVIAVHRPSGLYRSIADVRGATIKAGWIVLANGTEVGSLNLNINAANPKSEKAPALNLSTLTANDGGVTIKATSIDGETGSGF
jgi:hypothetical protein